MSALAQMPEIKNRNPFKFLNAFDRDEGKSFEGREEEISLLYDLIRRRNIVLVYGESGVGKTSLIQCGLANKFQSADWYDVLVLRNDNINTSLREALINHIGNVEIDKVNSGIVALIDALYIENFKPVYLIFDQLEELYVSNNEEERNIFYDTIAQILKASNSCCKIIFVIREDFLAKLNDFESRVAQLLSTGLRVTRMKPANALKVIKKALEDNVSMIDADPGIDEISESIAQACTNNGVIHLINLQICLHVLYNEAPAIEGTQRRLFTNSLIQTVTKADDLLKEYLEKTVKSISKDNEKAIWNLLNKFISTQNTKKSCTLIELYDSYASDSDINAWLEHLKEKQFLRQTDEKHLELMHDSLVPVIQKFQPKTKRPRLEKPILQGNPYKGLLSYDESDLKMFYGRQEVIYELYEKVKKSPVVPVVGASGAGKSSLIKAGVFPKLRENGFTILPVIKPGKFPEENIDAIISAVNCDTTHCKYILYIDQYEEVVSQCEDPKKRQAFVSFLKTLIEEPQVYFQKTIELKLILSVRSDFEPQVQGLFLEEYWNNGRYTVPAFSKDQLREIIEEPAYLAGLAFNPANLVDTIASEVDQRSNLLPLLSYTLRELYVMYEQSESKDGFLTQKDYEALGGVVGSLSKRADAIYDGLDKRKQRAMQNVFIRMLSLSSGELAGRRAAEAEFVYADEVETKTVCAVLSILMANRLIYRTKNTDGEKFYEPAHDSLVRSWGKLWSWINEENGKEVLSLQSQLRAALLSSREGVFWNTNTRLYLLEDMLKSKDNWLNQRETEFVHASISKRNEQADIIKKNEQEKVLMNQKLLEKELNANVLLKEKLAEEKKRTDLLKRSRAGFIAGLIGLAILAGISIYYSKLNEKKVKQERILKNSLRVANVSLRQINDTAVLKRKEALESVEKIRNLLITNERIANKYKSEKEKAERVSLLFKQANIDLSESLDRTKIEMEANRKLLADYERALARYDLQKEPFYTSALDQFSKEQFIDTLLATKFDEKNVSKYTNLITALNKVSDALNAVGKNPNKGLVIAKQAYDIYPHEFIDSIGLSIANNNLFYINRSDVTYKLGSRIYLTAFSNDRSHFAFATLNGIRTGIIKNDSIILDNEPISDYLSNESSSSTANNYSQAGRFSSLTFTSHNDLIAITTDNKIYRWSNIDNTLKVQTIPWSVDSTSFKVAAVSPDGKKMIGDYNNTYVKILDLENVKNGEWKKPFTTEGGKISGLIYSPDGKKVIVTSENYRCWILDMELKSSKKLEDSLIFIASFTPDGKNIMYEGRDSIWMSDLEGNKAGNKVFKNNRSYARYNSQNLSISNDWKGLLLQHPLYGSRLYESWNEKMQKDSLFYFGPSKGKVKTTRVSADGAFDFVNDHTILSYTRPVYIDSIYNFSILLLKRYGYFSNFLQAYTSINPYLTEKDKKEVGLVRLSETEMYEKALRYNDLSTDNQLSATTKKDYLLKAKVLFNDLLSQNKDNEDYFNSLKLTDRRIYSIDSNFIAYANEVRKHIEIEKLYLAKYAIDTFSAKYKEYKRVLSTDYGNMSYYLLFADQPDFAGVIENARKGLAMDPTNDYIYTNLAAGYLLNKDTTKAKEIYKTYKNEYSIILKRGFKSAFLEDLVQLERKNIISPKNKEVFDLAQRIRCWLEDKAGCLLK